VSTSAAPRRVRVTGPRAGRRRRASIASEIDAQTELGEVYMRSLMRSQLRLALGVLAVLVLTLGMLPLLFARVPALQHARILGVPLGWLLLGVGAYPLLVALAAFYVRRAERNERAFHDLVGPR
jgi:putative solute:sodium symporter small subunit